MAAGQLLTGIAGYSLTKPTGEYLTTDGSDPSGNSVRLDSFRLSGAKDAPADLSLGAYGDEFEYTTDTGDKGYSAIWTPRGTITVRRTGSSFALKHQPYSGLFRSTALFAANFEVAFLLSEHMGNGGMYGISFLNDLGTGVAFTPYNDNQCYQWGITAYGYNQTQQGGGVAFATWEDGRPTWLAVKKSGNSWRLRGSIDGGVTWTTLVNGTSAVAFTQMGYHRNHSAGASETHLLHRFVYGTPDLGLG